MNLSKFNLYHKISRQLDNNVICHTYLNRYTVQAFSFGTMMTPAKKGEVIMSLEILYPLKKIKYLAKFISVILNAHICSFFPRGILPSSLDRNWSTSSSTTLMLALSPVAPKLVKLVVLAFLLPPKLLRLAVLAGLVDKMPPESPVSIAVAEEPPAPAVKYIWSPCLSKIRERTQLTFNKILLQ